MTIGDRDHERRGNDAARLGTYHFMKKPIDYKMDDRFTFKATLSRVRIDPILEKT